jgi:hypothetical protein
MGQEEQKEQEQKQKDEIWIKSIHIKNVRGIKELNQEYNILPNIPNIMVAPNGDGKSSFATAFRWASIDSKLKARKKDAYEGRKENEPELTLTIYNKNKGRDKDLTLKADKSGNEIKAHYNIFVINSALKAVANRQKNGEEKELSPHISGPMIRILKDLPVRVPIQHELIGDLLDDDNFMRGLDLRRLQSFRWEKDYGNVLAKIKNDYENLKGILDDEELIERKIIKKYREVIKDPQVEYAMKMIQGMPRLLKAVSLVDFVSRNQDLMKERKKYYEYQEKTEETIDLFNRLNKTWLDIGPEVHEGDLCLNIEDVQRISNGERDTLNFMANLERIKYALQKKSIVNKEGIEKGVILIIDEVFDYLDDANMMAAQYYIGEFIKEFKGRYIYPIILTHAHPGRFYSYIFDNMKVHYLRPSLYASASKNLMKLIRNRDEWKTKNKKLYEKVSKYMFHFYPDKKETIIEEVKIDELGWDHVEKFKGDCMKKLEQYLNSDMDMYHENHRDNKYDALGVCFALREMVEKYCYYRLKGRGPKHDFLSTHKTLDKILFAKENGVMVPPIFSLLSPIYNEPLHGEGKENIKVYEQLFSRLQNKTIKHMIGEVKKACSEPIK